MTTHLNLRAVAAVALVAFLAGCLAAVSQAQEPAPSSAQRTVVAVGNGQAKVTPANAKDNASIAAAVEAAETKALTPAIVDAKQQAQQLATAVGGTLGTLLSITNAAASNSPYYGPFFATNGTFGPGRYCAKIRTVRFVKGKDGKRHRITRPAHLVCRFPSSIQRSVQLTYALT